MMMAKDRTPPWTPQAALRQSRDVAGHVRAAGRWHGWMWLTVAIATPIFLIGTRDGGFARPYQFWVALAFCAVALALTVWDARRGVQSRVAASIDRPITWAYVATVLVVALVILIWDPSVTPGFVILALLPSIPCVLAAWLVLRR